VKIVDPGRAYELAAGIHLHFLQKHRGEIIRDGTTVEEVLEVLIDRVTDGYQRLPCAETIRAVHCLREALRALHERTAQRVDAEVEGTYEPHGARSVRAGDVVARVPFDLVDLAPN
jgi:hypothetical protein